LSLPAGSVIAFAGNPSSAPSGFLLCNGAKVSRTTYSALFSAIGTLYGTGDGSTTFTLPNMTDKFIQGSGTSGTVKNAGLPDHRHLTVINTTKTNKNPTSTSSIVSNSAGGQSNADYWLGYDSVEPNVSRSNLASISNSIYGASSTVQPPAITMRFYIKY
jgi:microcystin-dependent protein